MVNRIKDILSEYSGIRADDINEDTELIADLGLSSLDVVNVAVAFEDEFRLEIPDSDIKNLQTVDDIIQYLKGKVG